MLLMLKFFPDDFKPIAKEESSHCVFTCIMCKKALCISLTVLPTWDLNGVPEVSVSGHDQSPPD